LLLLARGSPAHYCRPRCHSRPALALALALLSSLLLLLLPLLRQRAGCEERISGARGGII
jgi:hypothetical protein